MGFEKDEMIGREFQEFKVAKELPVALDRKSKILKGEAISNYRSTYLSKDGEERVLVLKSKPLKDNEGKIIGVQGTASDVTGQLQTERALEESRQREKQALRLLNDAIESLPGSFAIYDAEDRFVMGNRNTMNMFPDHAPILKPGTSYEDVVKTSMVQGLVKIDPEEEENYIQTRLRQFRESPEFFEQKWRDGRWFAVYHRPTSEGGIVTIRLDITAQKQMEEQLRQSQKMQALGTLAGGVAHDFNNILAPILGYAELLVADLSQRSAEQQYADSILQSALRARDLVSQILLFSRHSQTEKKVEDVSLLIPEIAQLTRSTLPATIVVNEKVSTDTAPVLCVLSQIHQVLLNLCINAGQAIDDVGEIDIKITTAMLDNFKCIIGKPLFGEYVRIEVTDNGKGMDKEILDHIFEPFYTTKEVGTGTGLGLSTVFGIVQDHNGGISVSSAPGQGATFEILLPLTEAEVEQKPQTMEITQNMSKGNILLIDDEELIRSLGKTSLERTGYSVTVASDGQTALDIFSAEPGYFDIIITDQTMPKMTGDQLAQQMLKIRADIPIIVCTGHSTALTPESSRRIGISKFLYKPYKPSDLSAVVQEVLGEAVESSSAD